MKKLLLSLFLAGALGAAVFASASALPIQNTTIQGVTSAVVNCQPSTTPVHVKWIVTNGSVNSVQITGISTTGGADGKGCLSGTMGGTVVAGTTSQELKPTTIPGSTVTFALNPAIDPASITAIKLFVSKG